jgi:tRNA(Ile)-lysidine synthase
MMNLLQRFKDNWHKHLFAKPGDKILLAVSGGSDSMCMADLFLKSGKSFAIAHCNFQLRGEESDKDEALVRDWALVHSIPLYTVRFDTAQKMEEWKKGVQETARILRYEWFEQIREEHKYACIATAHNANDNVETVLINLFKGTGISGLHGIQLKNNAIIRPLLFAEKAEILQYVSDTQVPFREDASNDTDNYLRNAVRHHIVPVAKEWFHDAVKHVNDTVERLGEVELLYNKAIEQERKKLLEKRGNDYYIPVLKLNKRDALNTLCYELFKPFGFTSAQVPQIISLLSSESGHYISSATHRVIRNRDFLIVTHVSQQHSDFIQIDGLPSAVHTAHHSYSFKEEDKPAVIPGSASVALIDNAKLQTPLILRRWKQGDYFYPLGMGMKKKKISKYFIDQKIPLHEKENVWVLESNKRIVWITGMRLDERFKITDKTTKVLRIEMKPV